MRACSRQQYPGVGMHTEGSAEAILILTDLVGR